MYPDDPFRLQEIKLQIPKGAFVAIVGRIGSGKSALLQGIIGSMRQTHGYSHFGGSLSYVAQQSWIQNATLRQNIAFNQEEVDEVRLRRAIAACSLSRDIELLPDGLETEIGEHGINLSGGQKARTALARAVYKNADIVLLDSPLAAVDSHVAADLIENCLLHKDALGSKTRILITHHLEVLPKADMVLVMDKGRIIQQGTYTELLGISGTFRTLVEDHSTGMQAKEDVRIDTRGEKEESEEGDSTTSEEGRAGEPATKLILDEERNVGDVSWAVYIAYARVMSKEWTFAFAMIMLVIDEASSVLNTLFLGYWSGSAISGFRQGDYMGLYAAFGGLQALCSFLGSYTLFLAGVRASYLLFDGALTGVLRSSNSFHDRTPVGRIVSRLTSDIERTDDRLTYAWYGYLSGLLSLVGLMSLVFYTFPPLGALFVPLGLAFGVIGALYRHTSRESKRVSSVAQSFVYSSIGEQLDGMTTIRAFGLERTFQKKIRQTIDAIGSADYVASTCRRWMVVRCEMLSAILLLGIVAFGLGYKNSVDPVKFGVVLTYTLRMGTAFQQTIEAATRTEQEMNATERLLHFTELPREAAPRVDDDPPKEWPQRGQVVFKRVCLQYRPDLPLVLRDISFQAEAGEKIGIVGRTGAGKSSLAQALFRLVELTAGSIYIDGVDLSIIGLDTLRSQLSALPQDTLLFSGTMRENIDPTREKADPELNDTMRRCGLILSDEQIERGVDQERYKKFQLDAIVSDDGSNFSGGERQLVALCRALVKGSKLLLLDEATSSVDAETDATIQKCIRSEFSDVTLLCIAHRLATIAFYDKVLVMDSGQIAEFDNPLILFDRPDSIFRSMCDSAKLTREAIVRIRVGENWEEMERSVVHDHRLGRVDTIRLSGQGD